MFIGIILAKHHIFISLINGLRVRIDMKIEDSNCLLFFKYQFLHFMKTMDVKMDCNLILMVSNSNRGILATIYIYIYIMDCNL